MTQYEMFCQRLMQLSQHQVSQSTYETLQGAARLLKLAEGQLNSVKGIARDMGYAGDDCKEAFEYLKNLATQNMQTSHNPKFAAELRDKLLDLVVFINREGKQ